SWSARRSLMDRQAAVRCVGVRHVLDEDLGVREAELGAQGLGLEYLEAGVGDLSPLAEAPFAIVLGGPIGVGDAHLYPAIGQEIELLRTRLAADLPTVGVCLGRAVLSAWATRTCTPPSGSRSSCCAPGL